MQRADSPWITGEEDETRGVATGTAHRAVNPPGPFTLMTFIQFVLIYGSEKRTYMVQSRHENQQELQCCLQRAENEHNISVKRLSRCNRLGFVNCWLRVPSFILCYSTKQRTQLSLWSMTCGLWFVCLQEVGVTAEQRPVIPQRPVMLLWGKLLLTNRYASIDSF